MLWVSVHFIRSMDAKSQTTTTTFKWHRTQRWKSKKKTQHKSFFIPDLLQVNKMPLFCERNIHRYRVCMLCMWDLRLMAAMNTKSYKTERNQWSFLSGLFLPCFFVWVCVCVPVCVCVCIEGVNEGKQTEASGIAIVYVKLSDVAANLQRGCRIYVGYGGYVKYVIFNEKTFWRVLLSIMSLEFSRDYSVC